MGQDSVIVKGNQTYKFQQSEARLYGGKQTSIFILMTGFISKIQFPLYMP